MAEKKDTSTLPERTVERLSEYRRTLLNCLKDGRTHIYSHELAGMHGITAVQVRRDLMLIGFTSDNKKGYMVQTLVDFIGQVIDSEDKINVGIIGMGNLGRAITSYFNGKRTKLSISAAFDVDPSKVGKNIAGVPCYHIDTLAENVGKHHLKVIILTLPAAGAEALVPAISDAGIKGVLNFTSTPLNFAPDIFVEDYDIISLLEKVAYFTKHRHFR